MWARDAAAIYGAMVFLLWLSGRLVAHQGPWIPALTVALLVYAARKLVLAKYATRASSDKQTVWFVLACTIAAIALAVELVVALGHDFEPVFLLGALLVPYACGLTFYRRRILTRFDLEWIRGIVQDRFEEIGDSTEVGQSLNGLLTRVDSQISRWQP
jgi:hypothetical protein